MPVMKTLTINGRTYTVTPVVPTDSVTLLASAWAGEDHKYSQVVELSGVTPHTKVDLQPTSEQLVEFHDKVLGFVAENDGGVVTVYSIGDKPSNDHTIQVTMTEVDATGKIRGNTVGTTMPRSDWAQTDPTKADYIKNKPTGLGGTGDGSGQNVELDTTLTESGKAADAKAVGDALDELEEKIPTEPEDIGAQPKGNYLTKAPVESVNGKTGAVTVPVPNIDGLAQIEYVDSSIASEAANRKKDIADLEVKMNQQSLNFAEGDTMEAALAWLKENGDPSKHYIMPDNFFYRCVEKTTTGGTVPNFTNVLDTATISLNDRYSLSTHALKGAGTAAGFVAIDHIPVTKGQIIRVSKVDALDGKYSRIIFYDSAASPLSANDVEAYKYAKLTKSGDVVSFVAGYYNITSGNDSTNTSVSGTVNTVRMNLYISGSSITAEDIADLIVTVDEPIEYTTAPGGTELVWESTGRSFISTEYDDQIADLRKDVDELKATTGGADTNMVVYAPSPQLPADGSDKADFNAETITCKDIYDYIDALAAKYPKFITKEILGKDQSGEFDWNRYTCCRRYYEAWCRDQYPKMYGWTNGSATIYSVSVSPRIGDTLYTTKYVGTAKGTVSAVSNADQTRTVAGVVYTRDKTKDVEPTLIYSVMLSSKAGNSVYNSSKVKVTTISSITSTTLVGADGNTYHRYPLGDRNANFVKPKVIVIGSNEHGRPLDPAEPAIISARMIKDLCECTNANNPFLNTLKNEYMVVFLPIINPWGYDNSHKSYYNSRGVNLDRNLDTPGWGNDTSNPQGEYGGSEAEMQYFMNTLVESGAKIVSANHALGTQTNSTGEGANSGRCHYMLGRNNSKYDQDLLVIAETMLANYNLFFTDYGEAPPESYAKTRSYIDWIGAEGGAVEMQAREGYVLDGTSQLHTARILEADYTLLLQFLHMLIKHS